MTTRIEIDLDAFRANVLTLAAIAAPARTMLAVKADGYGHGMVPIARAALASGADSLAVLDVTAALELRAAGIEAQLFAWLHGEETDFRAAVEHDVDLGVSSLVELRRIVDAGADRPATLHLKIDTGLHRNGASPEDWPVLVGEALAAEQRGQARIAGIWSHLADASPADDRVALAEFRAALAVAAGLGVPMDGPDRPLLHLAASSAGIRMPEARFDLVRFGIAAYGSSPFDDQTARDLGMRAPMTVYATVIASEAGTSTLDLGSADGIPSNVQDGRVLLDGKRVRVRTVDVDTIEVAAEAPLGTEAIVFGPGDRGEPTAEEWAAWADTIGDEILARASRRIPRVILGE
ncbi:alanine racemase [Pseudolysinimonas sp.]|jgi:alanine racemase|uniref:alanine racemase n=1 Tax=Pseudolysinimonas sp. TaxID=2680009 RepID=UPI0037846C7A